MITKRTLLIAVIIVCFSCKKKNIDEIYLDFEIHSNENFTLIGDVITFENLSSGIEVSEWDFGDGTTSSIKQPTHVYNTKGPYIVKLTVYDETGAAHAIEREIDVLELKIDKVYLYPPDDMYDLMRFNIEEIYQNNYNNSFWIQYDEGDLESINKYYLLDSLSSQNIPNSNYIIEYSHGVYSASDSYYRLFWTNWEVEIYKNIDRENLSLIYEQKEDDFKCEIYFSTVK